MTPAPQPKAHPLFCGTCGHHTENQYMDFCHGYPISKDDPTEILIHISKYGCASHTSSAQERIDAVIKEIENAGIRETIALLQAGRK